MFAKDDGRAFGDDIGRFRVAATLDSSSCGANALGAPENWQFDVVLSRDEPRLFWNTNASAVEGTVDARGHFAFESQSVVNAGGGAQRDAGAGCAIVRKDVAAGTLDDPSAARAFEGSLEYSFSPQGTADCSAAMLENGILTLPCSMSYRMKAEWVSER